MLISERYFQMLLMFFIILTAGSVLFNGGIHKIDTVNKLPRHWNHWHGNLAYLLFAAGVIGTGFLAIPVLSGSISYIIQPKHLAGKSLDKKFSKAKSILSPLLQFHSYWALSLNYIGIRLFMRWFIRILYGLTAPVLIAIILHISNNKKNNGKHTNGKISNILGFAALLLMTARVWF